MNQGYWKKKWRLFGELVDDQTQEQVVDVENEFRNELITEVNISRILYLICMLSVVLISECSCMQTPQ